VFEDEDALIDELDLLKQFLSEHKNCIHDKLGIENLLSDDGSDVNETQSDKGESGNQYHKEVQEIIAQSHDKEVEIQKKLEAILEDDQKDTFDAEIAKNEDMKKNLVNEFKAKMAN